MNEKNPIVLIISAVVLAVFLIVISVSVFKSKTSSSKLVETDIEFMEHVYDFGIAKDGEQIEHTFKFRNVGQNELIIERVNAPCGCTAAVTSAKTIAPGDEGKINASFNTKGYSGFISQNIYIDSNAPPIQLKIEGIVETVLSVIPQNINLGTLGKGIGGSKSVHMHKGGDEGLKILRTETSSEYFLVNTRELPQEPPDEYRKKFEIEIIASPEMPIGVINETITIYTNDEIYPKVEVPVTGNVRMGSDQDVLGAGSPLLFFPPLFFFGSVKQGETPSQKINLQTIGSEPLEIEKIENYLEKFVSITVNPKIEGKEYEIVASLKDNVPTGKTEGFIVIYTNNPDKTHIEIPINIFVEQ